MRPETDRDSYLRGEIEAQGIEITGAQTEQLLRYYDMLIQKNKVMNLTRITDFRDATEKHFVDSLMVARYINMEKVRTLLDLGSGAGFPGIPLKILYPHLQILLIDSVGKKMHFVKEVIRELGLLNAEALHARAEDLAREKDYREQFDLCVSRAVANLSTLSEYCLPFVRTGGAFAAYKGGDALEEIEAAAPAISRLGGATAQIHSFSLYGMGRCIVEIPKTKGTPALYPRKAGIPSRDPLC